MELERFNTTLQENLITVLAYDDQYGGVVANVLDINLLDGDYRLVAERCVDYWRTYKEAPKDHTADLVSDILEDKLNRRSRSIRRILTGIVQLSDSVNTKYVMNQLRTFSRMRKIMAAVIDSAERLNSRQHMAVHEVEDIWNELLRHREIAFDVGTKLTDVNKVLEQLARSDIEFKTGIKEFDKRGIVPARGRLFVLLGAAGRGKSWAMVHLGVQALQDRKKVLHVSLEMSEEEVIGRYYQSLFAVAKKRGDVEFTRIEADGDELVDMSRDTVRPAFVLQSEFAAMNLTNHVERMGRKAENLIVKQFPPRQMGVNALAAYIDTLEATQGWIPDLVIVDYLGITKIDPKNLRVSLGQNTIALREMAVERNIAMVAAHQVSKVGAMASNVRSTHVAEDWSIIMHADVIVSYSCTELEFKFGLGRLWVDKARSDEDRFGVIITQSYKIGQFVLSSHSMRAEYDTLFKDLAGVADNDSEADEGEDE